MFARYSGHLNIAICPNKPSAFVVSCDADRSGVLIANRNCDKEKRFGFHFFPSPSSIASLSHSEKLHPTSPLHQTRPFSLCHNVSHTMILCLVYITLHEMCYYN